MRIALLVDPLSARLRGGEHPRELAAALLARGHGVRIFGARGGAAGRGTPRDAGSERERVQAFEPEALIAYDPLSPAGWLASRIARRRGLPLVLVEEGPLRGADWVERALLRAGESLWGSFVRHTPHGLVAVDPVARERALSLGFDAHRVELLPHGVDTERFRPDLASPLIALHRIRGRILLHPGGCEAGAEVLIGAFGQTVGRRGDWALVLAAPKRPERLRACADRAGIGASVHLLQVGEADLPELYASSTLVALPDLSGAPGQGLQRAWAAGKPVLASDLPGLRFLFERAGAGLLAAPGDARAWTEALRQAAASPQARLRWGAAALAAARAAFSWPAVAEGFEQALERCAARAPARGLGMPQGA